MQRCLTLLLLATVFAFTLDALVNVINQDTGVALARSAGRGQM